MAKGIIYVMTTAVPGLIKIGKTGSSNFEQRMYSLEHDGYRNVTALKRLFAIEVDDYDEKELLIDSIFSKSRLENTELFALDSNLAVQLLSSFEGKQIYPMDTPKDEVFEEASANRGIDLIPNGEYFLNRKIKNWDNRICSARMEVKDGRFIVKKGSTICPIKGKGWRSSKLIEERRAKAIIKDDILQRDEVFTSPFLSAAFVTYAPINGWKEWSAGNGDPIDIFRK